MTAVDVRAETLRRAANAVRARHRLILLAPDARLTAAAVQHAERMRNLGYFAHEDPYDGTSLGQRLDAVRARGLLWAGENLALCDDRAERAVALWLGSDGHRANLLSPAATRCGQAATLAPDGRVFWVQLYGRGREDETSQGSAWPMIQSSDHALIR